MNRTVEFRPHKGQLEILDERVQFNTVNCGRQTGKTTLAEFLIMESVSDRKDVAYFAPTYRDAEKMWNSVVRQLTDLQEIRSKKSDVKVIRCKSGAELRMFSLDNVDTGRGNTLDRIIIDECRMIRKLKVAWMETLSATLAKRNGDAYFLSTPDFKGSEWEWMCLQDSKSWKHFHMKTEDNPHIPRSFLKEMKAMLPDDVYLQEYEGVFVSRTDNKFFYEWKEHFILKGEDQIEIDRTKPVYISFDFNVDPTSAVLFQIFEDDEGGYYFIDELSLDGGTKNLCNRISSTWDISGLELFITGDRNGNTRTSSTDVLPGGEYNTDYTKIKDHFDINDYHLLDTRTVNKRHVHSRGLINTAMANDLIYVNERCKGLIQDIRNAIPDNAGKLKKDRQMNKMDLCDAFRYGVHLLGNIEGVKRLVDKIDSYVL